MLVNAQNSPIVQHTQRTDMDPTTAAASALYSGLVQNPQAIQTPVGTSAASNATADNVDAAFAKTRVLLQATEPATVTPLPTTATESSALKEFKEYMNTPVAQRIRDQILKDLGITEEDLKTMSPEKREALEHQIADRIKDKANLQQAEQQLEKEEKTTSEPFIASN